MKIGLFLDIDGVCTEEAVNLQYARMLGIEKEHEDLENLFNTNRITTAEFGQRLVKAFRKKDFTLEYAAELMAKVRYRPYSEDLFDAFEDVFIVSSAPSYFIESFAEKYSIPSERILCSKYEFDNDGMISRCSNPVNAQLKADFVGRFKEQYNICIGVGDVPDQDAAFLSHCDIRILMAIREEDVRPGFFSVKELAPVKVFLDNMKKCIAFPGSLDVNSEVFADVTHASKDMLKESPYEKNVFIMTPFRDDDAYKTIIEAIKYELRKHKFKGWIASDKKLHKELWPNVQAFMLSCKYGIAVFAPYKDRQRDINPNVSIELGFMLSRGKEVLILKENSLEKLPSDLMGSLYEKFNLNNTMKELTTILERWHDDRLRE